MPLVAPAGILRLQLRSADHLTTHRGARTNININYGSINLKPISQAKLITVVRLKRSNFPPVELSNQRFAVTGKNSFPLIRVDESLGEDANNLIQIEGSKAKCLVLTLNVNGSARRLGRDNQPRQPWDFQDTLKGGGKKTQRRLKKCCSTQAHGEAHMAAAASTT